MRRIAALRTSSARDGGTDHAQPAVARTLEGARVLELGSGVGMLGLALANTTPIASITMTLVVFTSVPDAHHPGVRVRVRAGVRVRVRVKFGFGSGSGFAIALWICAPQVT